jgi:5-methylcytosine-specific restriction endonuclease McrA
MSVQSRRIFADGSSVVLLDAAYQFAGIVSWKRAMVLMVEGKIEVIRQSQRIVRTVTDQFIVPAVAILKKMVERIQKSKVPFTRRNLFMRDKHTCQYCGNHFASGLTVDHVVPRAKGGKTSWENCVASCKSCNDAKGDKTLAQAAQAGLKLRSKPYAPTVKNFLDMVIQTRLGISLDEVFSEI